MTAPRTDRSWPVSARARLAVGPPRPRDGGLLRRRALGHLPGRRRLGRTL